MPTVATMATSKLRTMLTGENGIAFSAAQLVQGEPDLTVAAFPVAVMASTLPLDLAERSPVTYPSVQVSCEKLSNTLREKFRTFSGKAHLVVEIRASSAHAGPTEDSLQLYTQSVLQVLHRNRGDWGGGMFYGGGYEVSFAPVRRGGSNFLQIARVSLALDVCID
ncbi:MAG TPA: hypothetical protein VM120_28465 [Bryobacteraceae bacterium]|nr:hypothetical protein [Bryobacteraceae bacterium]